MLTKMGDGRFRYQLVPAVPIGTDSTKIGTGGTKIGIGDQKNQQKQLEYKIFLLKTQKYTSKETIKI